MNRQREIAMLEHNFKLLTDQVMKFNIHMRIRMFEMRDSINKLSEACDGEKEKENEAGVIKENK